MNFLDIIILSSFLGFTVYRFLIKRYQDLNLYRRLGKLRGVSKVPNMPMKASLIPSELSSDFDHVDRISAISKGIKCILVYGMQEGLTFEIEDKVGNGNLRVDVNAKEIWLFNFKTITEIKCSSTPVVCFYQTQRDFSEVVKDKFFSDFYALI